MPETMTSAESRPRELPSDEQLTAELHAQFPDYASVELVVDRRVSPIEVGARVRHVNVDWRQTQRRMLREALERFLRGYGQTEVRFGEPSVHRLYRAEVATTEPMLAQSHPVIPAAPTEHPRGSHELPPPRPVDDYGRNLQHDDE